MNLFITKVLIVLSYSSMVFATEPQEYGPVITDDARCETAAPVPAIRQKGETWCSYQKRFLKYLEFHKNYDSMIRKNCGALQPSSAEAMSAFDSYDNLNCAETSGNARAATVAEKKYLCEKVNNFLIDNGYDRALDMYHCLKFADFQIQSVPEATVIVNGSLLYSTPEKSRLKMNCNFAYNGSQFSIDRVIQEPMCN